VCNGQESTRGWPCHIWRPQRYRHMFGHNSMLFICHYINDIPKLLWVDTPMSLLTKSNYTIVQKYITKQWLVTSPFFISSSHNLWYLFSIFGDCWLCTFISALYHGIPHEPSPVIPNDSRLSLGYPRINLDWLTWLHHKNIIVSVDIWLRVKTLAP